LDLFNTNFVHYSRVEEVIVDLKIFGNTFDIAVVGGRVPDRALFAQQMLDQNCRCVILLDYAAKTTGYSKLKCPAYYDFRVFFHPPTHCEVGVYFPNYLKSIKIEDYV
jgi:hypothetical protein